MFLDALKTIYTKEKLVLVNDTSTILGLNKVLSKEESNIGALKRLIPFLFYVSAETFFYLLYFCIPKRNYVPKTFKTEKEEDKEDKLIDRIQYTLEWSKRELSYNRSIIESCMLTKQDYWRQKLGVR
jgi:hypothetical protein